jgi:ABC-type proline/glycine betaine transport system permease subunit
MAEVIHPPQPPPLHQRQKAVITYLAAVLLTVPTLALFSFSIIVHLPKLEQIWTEAGLDASRVQWLLDTCRFLPNNFYFICAALVLLLVLIEVKLKGWGRWRKRVLLGAVFMFQLLVMLELAFVTTASLLAVSKKMVEVKPKP